MRTTTIVFVTVLVTAAAAVAQPPLPVLQYDAPPNFYKSAMTNPEDFSSSEVNASVQVYPFRPFAGNIQQLVGQTLLRDWIDPRYATVRKMLRASRTSEAKSFPVRRPRSS